MQRKLCTRKIDEVGRIVLPLEARSALGVGGNQSVDMFIEDDFIIIRKNNELPACALCGDSETELSETRHSCICTNCISEIKGI